MLFGGLIVTLAGFALTVASLGISSSTSVRLVIVLAGIAVSLGGIMGLVNQHFLSNAPWKRS
jgi:hypothetical protein